MRKVKFCTDLHPPFWFPDAVGSWQKQFAKLLGFTPAPKSELGAPGLEECTGIFYSFLLSPLLL